MSILVLAVLVIGAAAVLAAAYVEARRLAEPLQAIQAPLARARTSLSHGRVPKGDPFGDATRIADEAQAELDNAGLPFRLVEKVPFLSRPVKDVRLGIEAATQSAQAASIARDLMVDLIGPGGSGPAPVFSDGRANISLIRSVPSRLTALITHMRAARRVVARIEPVPFFPQVADAKARATEEANREIALAQNGLRASGLLPTFFGADQPKTYFVALQNNSDQRATGGAVLAFALMRMDRGRISIQKGGPILDEEPKLGFPGVKLPAAVEWYLTHIPHQAPRISNLNFSPDFPTNARAWSALLEQGAHQRIDGAIALDPIAIAGIMGRRTIKVDAYPARLSSSNIVQVIEHDQYTLERSLQQAFPSQLIEAALPVLTDPHPFVKTMQALGDQIQQKHVQFWSADPREQALISQLRWDGAMRPGSGDFLYVTDNKLRVNKVDYFTHWDLSYRVAIDGNGDGRATAEVSIDNRTPNGEPETVAGPFAAYAVNDLETGLYVPRRARLVSQSPRGGYPEHVEGATRVFARHLSVVPGPPRVASFTYALPGIVRTSSGGDHVYELVVQHQPMANDQQVELTVTLPAGSTVKSAPGWTVRGTVLTYRATLLKDLTLRIVY